MNFNMNIRTIAFASAFLFSAGLAMADDQDATVEKQKSLLETLDSLNDAVLGLRVNGTAKAGGLTSMASSDNFAEESATQENQAFTDVDLRFGAHPSSETNIDVRMRLHKDWQSAYDENVNPIIGHWFSYDGLILDKRLKFNLGYMRVGYSPLTISTPQPELLQEPEILTSRRMESLERRNLDTTSRRLLQGLNTEYNTGAFGIVDNVLLQMTGARLRNVAKKSDQVFFDFDYSDRYLLGSRFGFDAAGVHVGANLYNVFDRKSSRRIHESAAKDSIFYEFNQVISAELGFDSKSLLSDLPVSFGLNGEYAMSKWESDFDYNAKKTVKNYSLTYGKDQKNTADSLVYYKISSQDSSYIANEEYDSYDGTSFFVEPFVKVDLPSLEASLKVRYLQTDENFWSEMASTPTFQGGAVILNSNALYTSPMDEMIIENYGSSSIENLYFNVYNTKTLNATNLPTSDEKNVLSREGEKSAYLYSRLYNNYKSGHFYRNGYSGTIMKNREIQEALFALDPTVSLAMPFGDATPDRKGIKLAFDLNWNDILTFNARFDMLTQENCVVGATFDMAGNPVLITEENKFTRYAAGVSFDFGQLLDLDRKLIIQGSYDHSEEDKYMKRKSDRIMGGLTLNVWGPVSILGSFQMYNREYDSQMSMITKSAEMLTLDGLRFEIAPLSYLNLQGGLLTNEVTYQNGEGGESKLSISKVVLAADVTVNF